LATVISEEVNDSSGPPLTPIEIDKTRIDSGIVAGKTDYRMPTELPITDVLRDAITRSGTAYRELERVSGVKRQSLMKFARGEQTLRLDMADKLAAYFGLALRLSEKAIRKSK
jgi:hypothetical protein